ncbi:MAG TPA: hypothetical protein VJ782_08885 [Aeromicrobium sp.]|nr:hypothetical protein [Aeromicrobium sp.]
MYRFRYLDEADAARWPGWYEVELSAFAAMDSGVVMEWEEATGYRAMDTREDSPANVVAAAKGREMKALLAVQWLAVRLSSDTTPWSEFRPKPMQVEYPPELLAAVAAEIAEESGEGNPAGPATNRATRRAKSASAAATSPRARKAAPRRSGS